MSNLDAVRTAFGRQGDSFDVWATKTDETSCDRFHAALDEAAAGHILDVACGPGVVTAALALHASSVVALDATAAMLDNSMAVCSSRCGLRWRRRRRISARSKRPMDLHGRM